MASELAFRSPSSGLSLAELREKALGLGASEREVDGMLARYGLVQPPAPEPTQDKKQPAFSADVLDPNSAPKKEPPRSKMDEAVPPPTLGADDLREGINPEPKSTREPKAGTEDVELPNGRIIQDVPKDVSNRELMDRAIELGVATPEDFEGVMDEETSAWKNFRYGYESTPGLTQMAGDFMESHFPLGNISFDFTDGFQYASPDDLYGEEFMQADPETRREMIFAKRQAELDAAFGEDFEPEGAAHTAGQIVGGAADVTSLIPAGQTVRGMMATGGALGGSYSALSDLSQGEDVDPLKAAISTAASAVLTPVPFVGGRYLKGKMQNKSAEKLVNKAQAAVNEKVDSGLPVDQTMLPEIMAERGIDPAKVSAAISNTGRKIRIPSAVNKAAKDAVAEDSASTRVYSKGLDKYLGSLSTRVRNISEPVFGRLREFEFNTHKRTQDNLMDASGFMRTVNSLPKNVKNQVTKHLYNGDFDLAESTLSKYDPQASLKFEQAKQVLDKLGTELQESGHSFDKVENYFPRVVKDLDGLLKSMGKEKRGAIEEALQRFAKSEGIPMSSITPQDRTAVIDMVTRGYRVTTDKGTPRFVKTRSISKITDDQLKYYAGPLESYQKYVRGAINDLERRKFFGRSLQKRSDGTPELDLSVGKFIDDEIQAGNLTADKQHDLLELLKARFIGGEQTPSTAISALKDLGYMGTIANPVSAVTQLGDMGISGSLKGFRNTIGSMFGTKDTKLVDLGIENMISAEMDDSFLRNALGKMFTVSGFRAIDRLGKETYINAALKHARGQLRSSAGTEKFRKKWGKVFGDEFENLVSDLREGRMTDNVKLYAFNELSDIQPISLSEMPQAYLENPNGRVLYMLKSFTLKQYDVVRRNVVQEWKKGNKQEAIKSATLLGGYMAAANTGTQTVKNFMLGRDVKPEDLPDEALWALLGVYGLNKYTSERYLSRGDVSGAVANTLMPATPIIDAAFKLGTELPQDDPKLAPAMRVVPVAGPLAYSWFGGGAEKYNERND